MPGFELEFAGTTRAQRHAPIPPLTDEQKARATITVCALAGRGLDVEIPQHLAAAARSARPVLEALGLLGDEPIRMSRYSKSASSVVHGTRSAAEAHQALGQALCQPCQRWADVDSRKHGDA